MIAKNTIFWRKENGGYKLYRYGTEEFRKVCGWGDHAPPLEEVRKAGFMTDLVLPIDSTTQKNGNRVDDGLSCWLEVVSKTAEEIAEYQAKVAAQKFAEFQSAIQNHLDDTARLSGYDNIVNACGYASAPNPFQAESQAFVSWRGNVWAYSYQMLADVESGARTEPTIDEVINELPKFNQGQ